MPDSALDQRLTAVLGGKTADALEKAFGMRTLGDLVAHVPRRYAHGPNESLDLADIAALCRWVHQACQVDLKHFDFHR